MKVVKNGYCRLSRVLIITLLFVGCNDPFSYPPLKTGFYSVDIDASAYESGNNDYFIIQIEDYIVTVEAGSKKSLGFDYYAGTICQRYLGGMPSYCDVDSTSSTLYFEVQGPPMRDLININFEDLSPYGVFINRDFPLTNRLFTTSCTAEQKNYLLAAIPNTANRLLFYDNQELLLDTTIIVGDSPINLNI